MKISFLFFSIQSTNLFLSIYLPPSSSFSQSFQKANFFRKNDYSQDFHHSQNPFLGPVLPFPSLYMYLSQYLLTSKGHLHLPIHSLPPPPPPISPHLTTDYKEDPDQPNIPIVISVFFFPFLFLLLPLFFQTSLPKNENLQLVRRSN